MFSHVNENECMTFDGGKCVSAWRPDVARELCTIFDVTHSCFWATLENFGTIYFYGWVVISYNIRYYNIHRALKNSPVELL